jgi:hypothetical protein
MIQGGNRRLRVGGKVVLMLAMGLSFAVLVEGFASVVHSVDASVELIRKSNGTEYDPQLGWVSSPSISLPSAWGDGRGLHTNRRGFRGQAEVEDRVAAGMVRILCSGDSFTFGEGVADDDTWCAKLGRLSERLELVNLGEPGYGIGQSFLRYQRDAEAIEHNLHIFAFIGDDLRRVGVPVQWARARPRLAIDESDRLVRTGGPVPYRAPALRYVARDFSQRLRTIDLARRTLFQSYEVREESAEPSVDVLAPLLRRIFESVMHLGKTRGAQTVFVYLPVQIDVKVDQPWRTWTRASLADLHYPFIDLTGALRALPKADMLASFISPGVLAESYYTELGHSWVARTLHAALRTEVPEFIFGSAAPVSSP